MGLGLAVVLVVMYQSAAKAHLPFLEETRQGSPYSNLGWVQQLDLEKRAKELQLAPGWDWVHVPYPQPAEELLQRISGRQQAAAVLEQDSARDSVGPCLGGEQPAAVVQLPYWAVETERAPASQRRAVAEPVSREWMLLQLGLEPDMQPRWGPAWPHWAEAE